MTGTKDKLAAVERILTRVAEQQGDITDAVMSRFYHQLPEARERFEYHGQGNTANLQGEMVSQALYCLMTWFESPGEIEILLLGSVPHHQDTLRVPAAYYRALIVASAEVVEDSIPAANTEERAAWREARDELLELVEQGAAQSWTAQRAVGAN